MEMEDQSLSSWITWQDTMRVWINYSVFAHLEHHPVQMKKKGSYLILLAGMTVSDG